MTAAPRRVEGSGSARTPAPAPRTAGEMLERARPFLEGKGVPEARLDAELLLAHALGVERLGLFLALDRPVTPVEIDRARELLVRRGRGEPTAYLTGVREFYGRPFAVGPGVLVPRPETELLVDLGRECLAQAGGEPRVLDVGTGSGCVAVTLALELPAARVEAVEVQAEALAFARSNAEALGARVAFHEGDAFAFLEGRGMDGRGPEPGPPFDLVVSNPPYVEPEERESLGPELDHEPAGALFAPEGDPDLWARRLLELVPPRLAPGGWLLVELGHRQGPRVLNLAREAGLAARLHPDLAGIERVLVVGPLG